MNHMAGVHSENRVYLSQISDGAQHLGLVDQRFFDSIFNLNCLFFDHIAIAASDLLGNPFFYRRVYREQEGFSRLLKNRDVGGQGMIQPILMGDHAGIEDVAQTMTRLQTIFSLSPQELEKHALLIHESEPSYLYVQEDVFRQRYYHNMAVATDLLNIEGLSAGYNIQAGSFDRLLDWLSNEADKECFRCSDLYRFADREYVDDEEQIVKILGETIYQFTMNSLQLSVLSTPDKLIPIIESFRKLEMSDNDVQEENKQIQQGAKYSCYDLAVYFDITVLSDLSATHLVKVRDLPSFRQARTLLCQIRQNSTSDEKQFLEMQSLLNLCSEELYIYALHAGEDSDIQLRLIVENFRKKNINSKLRVWETVSDEGVLLAIELLLGSFSPVTWGLNSLASSGVKSLFNKLKTSPNIIHQRLPYRYVLDRGDVSCRLPDSD